MHFNICSNAIIGARPIYSRLGCDGDASGGYVHIVCTKAGWLSRLAATFSLLPLRPSSFRSSSSLTNNHKSRLIKSLAATFSPAPSLPSAWSSSRLSTSTLTSTSSSSSKFSNTGYGEARVHHTTGAVGSWKVDSARVSFVKNQHLKVSWGSRCFLPEISVRAPCQRQNFSSEGQWSVEAPMSDLTFLNQNVMYATRCKKLVRKFANVRPCAALWDHESWGLMQTCKNWWGKTICKQE